MCIEQCSKYMSNFSNFFMEQVETVGAFAKKTYQTAEENFNYLERQVYQWSNANLPKPVVDIVQRAFQGLPVALAYLFLPAPIVGAAMISYCIVCLTNVNLLSPKVHQYIQNGLFAGIGVEALTSATLFALTGNVARGISAIVSATCAYLIYKNSEKLQGI